MGSYTPSTVPGGTGFYWLSSLSAEHPDKLRNARCANAHAAPPDSPIVAPRGRFVSFIRLLGGPLGTYLPVAAIVL